MSMTKGCSQTTLRGSTPSTASSQGRLVRLPRSTPIKPVRRSALKYSGASTRCTLQTPGPTDRAVQPPEITTTLLPNGTLAVSLPQSKDATSRLPHIQVERAGGALGATVRGVDLGNVTAEEVEEINRLFLEHIVLVFPDQDITPEQQMAFTRNWGVVEPHPLGSRKDIHPEGIPEEMLVVQNTMASGKGQARNDYWHSDISFWKTPAAVSVLYGYTVPKGYGDTCFANCYTGYEMLSDGLKQWLDGKRAVFSSKFASEGAGENKPEKFAYEADDVTHPVVRTHVETGRKSLYVGEAHCVRFEGLSTEESKPMLDFLVSKVTRMENVYRHKWSEKDVVMWDNRCALHYAVFDYGPGHARDMRRTCATDGIPM